MADKFLDLVNHILSYNNKSVFVVFSDERADPYFHANQLCELLEYADPKDALRKHVKDEHKFQLQDIVKEYRGIYKGAKGKQIF